MIDLTSHMEAYNLLSEFDERFGCGDPETFVERLFEQAALEVAREVDRFGPPDFRERFVRDLLWAWGATDGSLVEQVAAAAARLSAPDYYGEQIVSIVCTGDAAQVAS